MLWYDYKTKKISFPFTNSLLLLTGLVNWYVTYVVLMANSYSCNAVMKAKYLSQINLLLFIYLVCDRSASHYYTRIPKKDVQRLLVSYYVCTIFIYRYILCEYIYNLHILERTLTLYINYTNIVDSCISKISSKNIYIYVNFTLFWIFNWCCENNTFDEKELLAF